MPLDRIRIGNAVAWSVVGVGLVLAAPVLRAQDAPPKTRINHSIGQKVRFAVISGRIVAYRDRSQAAEAIHVTGDHERLKIDFAFGAPTLTYSFSRPEDELQITIREGTDILIRRVNKGAGAGSLEFKQSPDEPISLVVGEGEKRRTVRASTIWNLMLADPSMARERVIPLLELLRPDWNLASDLAALEEVLLRRASSDRSPNRRRLAQLVEQLGSDKFSRRRQAERELRSAGYAVLPYLVGLNRNQLNAEQWDRVRSLIDSLEDPREDRVDRMAVWMAGHEQTWLALMGRDEESKRRIAAERLSALIGDVVEFSPAADVATRGKQLDRLREQFDKPVGVRVKSKVEVPEEPDDELE